MTPRLRTLAALLSGFALGLTVACTGTSPRPCTDCGGHCVDLTVDSTNCGACGVACAGGTVCLAGACALNCPAGQLDCGGTCLDVQVDPQHCGTCTTVCTGACTAGQCAVPVCVAPRSTCVDGGCVDTRSDPANCGGCGTTCDGGFCYQSQCQGTCPLTDCSGACVDTRTDPTHCGNCGTACANGYCEDGGCVLSCPAPLSICGNGCVDTSSSPANCGTCGHSCALPHAQLSACVASVCRVASCALGFADTDGDPANGCEDAVLIPITVDIDGGLLNDSVVVRGVDVGFAISPPFAALNFDGTVVAFLSSSARVTPNDSNSGTDVFVRDLMARTTVNVTQGFSGGSVSQLALSANGRFVAFVTSGATNSIADTNGVDDVYLYDRATSSMVRVSRPVSGADNQRSDSWAGLALSDDGNVLVFTSNAIGMVSPPLSPSSARRLFKYQADAGAVSLLYELPPLSSYDGGCGLGPYQVSYVAVSGDGTSVAFTTPAGLVPEDVNGSYDNYLLFADGGLVALDTLPGGGLVPPTFYADGGFVCSQPGVAPALDRTGGRVASHGDSDLSGTIADNLNDVFWHDVSAQGSTQLSVHSQGGGTAYLDSMFPSLDATGTHVAFASISPFLVANMPTNEVVQRCFLATMSGTALASVQPVLAVGGRYPMCNAVKLSASGNAVLFASREQLAPTDQPMPPDAGGYDLYLKFLP